MGKQTSRRAVRMVLVISAAFSLLLATGFTPAMAAAAYSGFATGSAIHVDAATAQTARAVNIDVGIADAAVNESGLKKVLSEYDRPIVPAADGSLHARARASVLDVGAVLDPIDEEAQLKPFVALSEAPGGDRQKSSLLDQTIHPLIDVSLAERVADTKWNENTCVLGEPISEGAQHLAKVDLLDAEDNFDAPLLGLAADPPTRAVTTISSREQIFLQNGRGGLQSVVSASVAPVTFFGGTANEFTVEAGGPAVLSAAASGRPGGADVVFRAPLVTVIQDGERTTIGPNEPTVIRVPPGDGAAIAEIKIGTVDPLPAPKGLGDRLAKPDGTKAAGEVNVVEVTLLDNPDPRFIGARVAIGHMEASSTVPQGGIECGLPVTKNANPPRVDVNDLFTTEITIDNPFACTLTNVSAVDEITTQAGAAFEIVRTKPQAAQAPGGVRTSATVRWENLGKLEPGESMTLLLTMRAEDVGRILDVVTASGTLAGCGVALPGVDADDISVLGKARAEVDGVGDLRVNVAEVLGVQFLPQTGVGAVAIAVGSGMLGAASLLAGGLLRRRRSIH